VYSLQVLPHAELVVAENFVSRSRRLLAKVNGAVVDVYVSRPSRCAETVNSLVLGCWFHSAELMYS
jgi:hypothetical protein